MLTRFALTALAIAACAAPAIAQGRPDARAMTCAQVQSLIDQSGGVVLTTGQHTYDRYVAGRRFCQMNEITRPASILARDTDRCPVLRCEAYSRDDIWDRNR